IQSGKISKIGKRNGLAFDFNSLALRISYLIDLIGSRGRRMSCRQPVAAALRAHDLPIRGHLVEQLICGVATLQLRGDAYLLNRHGPPFQQMEDGVSGSGSVNVGSGAEDCPPTCDLVEL